MLLLLHYSNSNIKHNNILYIFVNTTEHFSEGPYGWHITTI